MQIYIFTGKTVAECQDSCKLSTQLQIVNTVADCQGSWRLSRRLQNVNTFSDSQDSCRLSRQLQTVNTVVIVFVLSILVEFDIFPRVLMGKTEIFSIMSKSVKFNSKFIIIAVVKR